jgi:hypothetical protein
MEAEQGMEQGLQPSTAAAGCWMFDRGRCDGWLLSTFISLAL